MLLSIFNIGVCTVVIIRDWAATRLNCHHLLVYASGSHYDSSDEAAKALQVVAVGAERIAEISAKLESMAKRIEGDYSYSESSHRPRKVCTGSSDGSKWNNAFLAST
ncbi:hypothetical protein SAMN05444162_4176 [Paenibacillaceae bacterium GAS479]|nr:hypothetical protein SAMN05444162_4176 [Paenibacillaceae bacterium GAS479]